MSLRQTACIELLLEKRLNSFVMTPRPVRVADRQVLRLRSTAIPRTIRAALAYIRPISSRMTTITTINPTPPLGA